MKKIFDLRFLIGLFFMVIGLILIAGSFTGSARDGRNDQINGVCGLAFTIFAGLMILGSTSKSGENK